MHVDVTHWSRFGKEIEPEQVNGSYVINPQAIPFWDILSLISLLDRRIPKFLSQLLHFIGISGLDAFSYSSLLSLRTAWLLPLEWLQKMRRLSLVPDVFCVSSPLTSLRKESRPVVSYGFMGSVRKWWEYAGDMLVFFLKNLIIYGLIWDINQLNHEMWVCGYVRFVQQFGIPQNVEHDVNG